MNASPDDFFDTLRAWGASDASWTRLDDGPAHLPFAVSIVLRLSDAIVDEIENEPTYTYFHHYRTVNALLDCLTLQAGLYLQERGARYCPVAASQSAPDKSFEGRYSHKKVACRAELGAMGRNNLFLHRTWGPRVRLATVFTDWDVFTKLESAKPEKSKIESTPSPVPGFSPHCASCTRCVDSCPAGAIGIEATDPSFNAGACSAWMKKNYQHIGRGVVCGICMRVCIAENRR